jgi:hypothetical protein
VKTQSREQRALMLVYDDASFILEPIVDRVMAEGLEGKPLLDGVAASAERVLRASLTDSGLPVNVRTGVQLRTTTIKAEARRIAKALIERLTVTNPDAVPPINQRRGLPAAVAAAAEKHPGERVRRPVCAASIGSTRRKNRCPGRGASFRYSLHRSAW